MERNIKSAVVLAIASGVVAVLENDAYSTLLSEYGVSDSLAKIISVFLLVVLYRLGAAGVNHLEVSRKAKKGIVSSSSEGVTLI